jgi:hypothetical protein
MTKSRHRWLLAAVGPILLGTVALVAPVAAHASSEPPWYPEANATGSLTFYNSSGQVITGGSITDAPFAAYVEASSNDTRSGDTKATLYAYTPVSGENPGEWNGGILQPASNYPNASAPAPLNTATEPVSTGNGADGDLASYIQTFPNTSSTAGYEGLYELRLKVTGPGLSPETTYWTSVISVTITGGTATDPTAGTWAVDWPPPSGPAIEAAVHGTGKVGSVETCVPSGTSTATSVTYAWKANGAAISGATHATYTVPASLLHKKLTCTVSAVFTSVTVALGPALHATSKPALKGPHLTGKAEKVSTGRWSPAASKYAYQWYVGSSKIRGATKSSYTVPKADKGKKIHCVVSASATGYATGTATTASVKIT